MSSFVKVAAEGRGVPRMKTLYRDEPQTNLEATLVELFDPLASYFYRRLDSSEDAADAAAETIEILLRKRRSIPKAPEDLRPFAFGVARNVLLHSRRSRLRKDAIQVRLKVELLSAGAGISVGSAERATELKFALESLSVKDREIVTLVAWEGFSLGEAARAVKLTPEAARKRYSRARQRLREQLK
ncbi:RNA polymerase sigma-70 factor (ECF subfamily) [Leucobacter luti]|uniref:RNA polymerase sigma factor n=1 Tax=Leucobacter luti TaxID=340320 RepID=UPI0010E9D915|nr:sigma-70 family RNA polymerase sigma factor [Leucobacter luti]MCW2286943.1 RNA polymerase sigma-70 factor (ECF subfamily) [Leucobacter luti]TCK41170.1 RNA polymerase sigma-70 factor (ECF subfamily) [Leucobacter luti]